jgi:hypothetical protein
MPTDRERFDLWYASPLRFIKEELTDGRAGFVVLGTACFLYERYAVASLKVQDKEGGLKGVVRQLASDFDVGEETADVFWDVIRDGMLHQGMPKRRDRGKGVLPRRGFNHDYPIMALGHDDDGKPFLFVQPFKFMDRVLELWENNFDLLQSSADFPWANISIGPVYEP